MSDIRPRATNVPKGLETTRDTRSSRLAWVEYLNSRTAEDSDKRRDGMVRLHRFAASSAMIDFDGSDDFVTVTADTRVVPWGTIFTLETLWINDSIGANAVILGRSAAAACGVTITHTTSSTVTTVVEDSAGTQTTITHTGLGAATVCAYQLVRNGASLSVKINGTEQTGTMSATLSLRSGAQAVAKDNAGSFLNGRIDFLRLFRYAKTNQYDGWARLVNPRAPGVVFDYVYESTASNHTLDRGSMGLHGVVNGTPATNGAPLAVNPVPVLGITSNLDNNSSQKVYVRAAGALTPLVLK